MTTNDILKNTPRASHDWNGKVSIEFGYPDSGWILLSITCTAYLQHLIIHLSDVYDPFPDMTKWMEDIAANNLPCEFTVDEEGECKMLRAIPLSADCFILEILDTEWDETVTEEQQIFMYTKVERRQFVSEFIHAWDDFLERKYDPESWPFGRDLQSLRGKPDLRELDISKAREFLASKSIREQKL
jgi:hypothetical protein